MYGWRGVAYCAWLALPSEIMVESQHMLPLRTKSVSLVMQQQGLASMFLAHNTC